MKDTCLHKQADPKGIQQINFTTNLDRTGNTRIYFILEQAKKIALDISQGKKFCKCNLDECNSN